MEKNNISFLKHRNKSNIQIHNKVLQLYKQESKDAIKLKNDIPIFLDTNVLLKSYSISFEAREKLYKFYEDYTDRIFITGQTQSEFIKNREDIIDRFHDDITNKLPEKFKSEIINKLSSFLESNKTVLVDYKDFEEKLKTSTDELKELSHKLDKLIDKKNKENNDILFNDPFLKIFSQTHLIDSNEEEVAKYIKEFEHLKKLINSDKLESELNKQGTVFPGMGDIKKKPNDPYGDYIIFHEMMKYAKDNSQDIIFLTYDTTKGDWMKLNKSPHIHYLENFYLNTGQMIYILDAKRIFDETLKLNFKSLIDFNTNSNDKDELQYLSNLRNFLLAEFPQKKDSNDNIIEDLRLELIRNGYESFEQIKTDMQKSDKAFEQYLMNKEYDENKFSRVGNLRVRLELSNENYSLEKSSNGYNPLYNSYKHLLNQNYS